MSDLGRLVDDAIRVLCISFEAGGYNPTPIIDLGVLVARADGTVDEEERHALREVFESLLDERLREEVVGHLISASLEVIEHAGAEPRARLVAEILRDCGAVEQGLLVALAIAFASAGLSKGERAVIEQIADHVDFPRSRLEELVREVSAHAGDRSSARDSLQVPASRRSNEVGAPRSQK
jgi:tellurite resistance protein